MMYKAKERYNQLSSGRTQFLDMAVECSELTLPYLIMSVLVETVVLYSQVSICIHFFYTLSCFVLMILQIIQIEYRIIRWVL